MRAFSLIPALLVAGCAAAPVAITTPFDASQAAAMVAPGPNTITGSALIRQMGGGVVTCAGSPVQLTPATAYARARFEAVYKGRSIAYATEPVTPFTPDVPAYHQLQRTASCNAQGFFRFDHVADGDYFLQVPVIWMVRGYHQGGTLAGFVRVRGGRTADVTLAP